MLLSQHVNKYPFDWTDLLSSSSSSSLPLSPLHRGQHPVHNLLSRSVTWTLNVVIPAITDHVVSQPFTTSLWERNPKKILTRHEPANRLKFPYRQCHTLICYTFRPHSATRKLLQLHSTFLEKDHLEDLALNAINIFKFVASWIQVVDWINLTEDSDKRQVLASKSFVNWGNFWSGELLTFHEGLRSTQIATVWDYGLWILHLKDVFRRGWFVGSMVNGDLIVVCPLHCSFGFIT